MSIYTPMGLFAFRFYLMVKKIQYLRMECRPNSIFDLSKYFINAFKCCQKSKIKIIFFSLNRLMIVNSLGEQLGVALRVFNGASMMIRSD